MQATLPKHLAAITKVAAVVASLPTVPSTQEPLPKYVTAITDKSGVVVSYQAQVRLNGHRFCKNYPTPEEAGKAAAAKAAEFQAKRLPTFNDQTDAEILADMKTKRLDATIDEFIQSKYATDYHRSHAATIKTMVGSAKIGDIRKSWIEKLIENIQSTPSELTKRPFAPSTVEKFLRIVGKVVKWKAESLDIDPPRFAFSINMIDGDTDPKRERRLSPQEEAKLLEAIRGMNSKYALPLKLLVRLDIETGARLQELTKARWGDIKPSNKAVVIPAAHCKTRTSREIPLTPNAQRIFEIAGCYAEAGSDRIFHAFPHARAASDAFARARKLAGIEDLRFHDLRHEALSRLVHNFPKMKAHIAAMIAGHTNSDMTQRYTHLSGEDLWTYIQ